LEAAQRRINDKIDPALLKESMAIIKKRADEVGWVYKVYDNDLGIILVAPEEWIKRSQGGKGPIFLAYLQLSSLAADGEFDHKWHLTDFLGLEGGATRKAISFWQEVLKPKEWRAVLFNNIATVQALRDLGFTVDEKKGTITLPVRLDSTTLQRGFEDDDLGAALAPVGAAFDLAVQALPHFQILASAALASSKEPVVD
jgi:hypothetical protein